MYLHQLKRPPTYRKPRKRVGRGNGSKKGTYSCRGLKGQNARAGGQRSRGFEGGQTQLQRKMPKLKGFRNINTKKPAIVNLEKLNIFNDHDEITIETLKAKNLIPNSATSVKILGKGTLFKKVKVLVSNLSSQAKAKIEK